MANQSPHASTVPNDTFPIVGIGASAGGLEAVRELFQSMPAKTGAGFVLIMHLDPNHTSSIAKLLAAQTPMTVVQASEGMAVEPDRLHVIPPNAVMTLTGGVLHLSEPPQPRGLRMPIDQFLTSLAEERREQSIAIVLSGMGSDGTQGARLINALGGMVMAQDPSSAGFDGMPRSAIATGIVDRILRPREMPDRMLRYLQHLHECGGSFDTDTDAQETLDGILDLLVECREEDFRGYKRGTLGRRIRRRMALQRITHLDDYEQYLRENAGELRALTKDLRISVTSFFRDPEAWALLREEILPQLYQRLGQKDVMRAWVPGCATGEEAYSLAMVLTEAGEALGRKDDLIVFATDLDTDALTHARTGVYQEGQVAGIAPERLERFFTRDGDQYEVRKRLREKVVFAPQNLLSDPPFSDLSLISCRNLLIYIEQEAQERILGLFYFALREHGCLFLGGSETVGQGSRLFEPVSKKWRIYRRLAGAVPANLQFPHTAGRMRQLPEPRGHTARRPEGGYGAITCKTLLDQFTPASVLVDGDQRVLYFHGPVREYLGPRAGEPSDDLFAMVGEGVRAKLRVALREARQGQHQVVAAPAHVSHAGHWRQLRITVTPAKEHEGRADLMLISFQDETPPVVEGRAQHAPDDGEGVVVQLEEELERAHLELRETIGQMESSGEELKASNEEILSMNEELQSTNEELETSKEELQSLNEELTTLNSQLESKVHELENTTNDLSNLLVSTEIATLFLARDLRIRRYTPAIEPLMRLIPSDIGRCVTDIAWRFKDAGLLEAARAVAAGREAEPHEIRTGDYRWYLRSILPYRAEDAGIEGVVITFVDITRRKRMEVALRQNASQLRRITDAVPVLISYIDDQLCYRYNNARYEQWFGVTPQQAKGKRVCDVLGEALFERVRPMMETALSGETVHFEDWFSSVSGDSRYAAVSHIPDRDDTGAVQGFYAVLTDLTDRRRAEQQIEGLQIESQRRLAELEALFDAVPVGIFLARDRGCHAMSMNRAGAELLRVPIDTNPSVTGPDADRLGLRLCHAGRELAADELPMQQAAALGRVVDGFEVEVEFDDGARLDLLTYAVPLFDESHTVRGAIGTFIDLTEKNRAARRYHETAERLRLHLQTSPLAAIEWDRELRVVEWPASAESLFGIVGTEAVGRRLGELGLLGETDSDPLEQALSDLIAGRVRHNASHNRIVRADGQVIWCDWFNSVLCAETGECVSGLSLVLDASDSHRLEEARSAHAASLEEEDRRKDTFLAMLGHELRNPLTPIRTTVALMHAQGRDIDLDWAARLIDRQTGHLEHMVDALYDLAQVRRGELSMRRDVQCIQDLIGESLAAVTPSIEEKHQHLTTELPQSPLQVMGDATRLIQVFTNLLNNAVRYTPKGGRINLSLTREDGARACIRVRDDGKGISAEFLPQVFDVYSRDLSHPERAHTGLGLGLTLVEQIMRLHGGSVHASSEGLGKGSCFTVCLPLIDAATTPEQKPDDLSDPQAAPDATPEQGALDILVVDDQADIRDAMQQLLSLLGHRVRTLDRGDKVVASVRESVPNLVLIDVNMPDMNGYAVARELAKLPERRHFKLIAVSGQDERISADAQTGSDFDAYLLKPVSLEQLKPYLSTQTDPSTGPPRVSPQSTPTRPTR